MDKNGPVTVQALGPCWLWLAAHSDEGYGAVRINKRRFLAHRVAYEWEYGAIPGGLVLDHLCRLPRCVNPTHLEAVTDRVNVLRGEGPAARLAARTHCPKGHPFSPENTYRTGRNGTTRVCRTCNLAWQRARREARRG